MDIPFDFRIVVGIIGVYFIFLRYTLSLKDNRIENIQKSLIDEIKNSNNKDISNAQRIINTKKISAREKNFIKRRYNSCAANYCASDWIRSISGISTIAMVFCVFLLIEVFIYSTKKTGLVIDVFLVSSQLVLFDIALLVWLVHNANMNTDNSNSFILLSLWHGLITIFLGVLMAIIHFCFYILPTKIAAILFYIFLCIPLIPTLIAFFSTSILYCCKKRSVFLLKKSVNDYQSGKLKQKLKKV